LEKVRKCFIYEIPICPICIEKLDPFLSGLNLDSIKSLFIYDEKERWSEIRINCLVC
jgi:hypothetical protein